MIGRTIGPYRVLGELGAGGMGEVYRAHDTRLDRDVALKVLPGTVAGDADRLTRFEREAKALASLNHPNIAQVYDTGRDGAVVFIAMELVGGQELSSLIARGPVPLPEAIAIARQIAAALEAAHEAGIIHRDLKPANIKIKDDGTVKVLDFGLAKALAADGVPSSVSAMNSPTLTARGTELGMILGTAAYMAPEQARGKPVDRRADLWAFGVILYEMLTGRRAFDGHEVSDVLASVLKDQPPLDSLPPGIPENIKRLLRRTLEKDRTKRLDSMAAARLELEDTAGADENAGVTPAPAPPAARKVIAAAAFVLAGALAGAICVFLYLGARREPPAGKTLVSQIGAPTEVISAFHDGFALSPDGAMLAFAARDNSGLRQIWIRTLDDGRAQPVQGTDGAQYPFWSPDSKSFAFLADGKLKRVDVGGGRLQTICDARGQFFRGSWGAGGDILWSVWRGQSTRLVRVPSQGGTPVPLDSLGVAMGAIWLSDGRRFLYAGGTEKDWGVRLGSVDGRSSAVMVPLPFSKKPFFYAGGLLLTNRNDTLTLQRFDEASEALLGTPIPIAPVAGTPKEWYAVSSDGHQVAALVRQSATDSGDPGDPMARLIWVDRQGNQLGSLGDPGHYWTLRLLPDGHRAVVNPGKDLWLLRSEGRHSRLTSATGNQNNFSAAISADGSEMVFATNTTFARSRIDSQNPPAAIPGTRGYPLDWSPDGRWLLTSARASSASSTTDIVVYDFQTRTLRPWLATDSTEIQPRFSPDGRWVAYSSNFSGRPEVYIRPFEGEAEPIAVSTAGGLAPTWRRDGNELFFLGPADAMMAVRLDRSAGTIAPGKPQRLFQIPLNDITSASFVPYDVTGDGQTFLLNVPDRPTPLFFLQGLDALVKK